MKNTILILGLTLIASFTFAQSKMEKEPTQTSKPTSIVFKSQVYDFGTIEYKAEAKGEFVFKNISKNSIQLTNVRASCGCTGTEWPKEEIKKRKKESIYVSYDTKRIGKFHKNVYVYIDGNANPIQLEIKGEVLKPEDGISTVKTASSTKTISPQKVKIDNNVKSATPNEKSSKTVSSNSNVEIKEEIKKEEKLIKEKNTSIEKQPTFQKSTIEKQSIKSKSE